MKSVSLEKSETAVASSYQARVEQMAASRYWPQFKWLKWFFEETGDPKSTLVGIFDSVEMQLTKRVFVEGWEVGGDMDLASALSRHRLNIATRIVVFVHDGNGKVDRSALETLCSAYDVDPLFVMSHFYWDCETQLPKPSDTGNAPIGEHEGPPPVCPPISLPSLVNFLSLDYSGQFSGLLLPDISPQTGKT